MSEQEIINKMGHMSMVGIAYQNNHDLDQPKIVDLLVTSFSGTLRGWWDSYPEIILNMLLKRMMKVCLFLMKVLVAVFLMVLIP